MQSQVKLVNTNEIWSDKRRYKINSVVEYSGSIYQNSTGSNSEPGIGSDWEVIVKKFEFLIQNDTNSPVIENAGKLRYRVSGNNSYTDMVMQTGASTYEWVNIVQNNW